MATIAILGATGVYGRHLIPRLIAGGHTVRALVRRPEVAGMAEGCGADIRTADIFDVRSLRAGLEGCDTSINLATSLPGPSGRGDFAVNDRVRREGAPLWLEACRHAGVSRVIQQSIAMVNSAGETVANEDTPAGAIKNPVAAAAVQAAIDMEAAVHACDLDWSILRGGLFYGPGTGFDDDWYARAREGKLRCPEQGEDFVSLVHISDMCSATENALENWPSRKAIIVCDDEPVRWRDLFAFIAKVARAVEPGTGGRPAFPSFRTSNAKAKALLKWRPFYRTFREGLAR